MYFLFYSSNSSPRDKNTVNKIREVRRIIFGNFNVVNGNAALFACVGDVIVNDAYNMSSSIDQFRLFFTAGYAELVEALQRLQGQLNKQGYASLAGRVTEAQSCLLGPAVADALRIRTAVLQRRRPRTQNPVRVNAQALANDVSFSPTIVDLIHF